MRHFQGLSADVSSGRKNLPGVTGAAQSNDARWHCCSESSAKLVQQENLGLSGSQRVLWSLHSPGGGTGSEKAPSSQMKLSGWGPREAAEGSEQTQDRSLQNKCKRCRLVVSTSFPSAPSPKGMFSTCTKITLCTLKLGRRNLQIKIFQGILPVKFHEPLETHAEIVLYAMQIPQSGIQSSSSNGKISEGCSFKKCA